MRLTELPPWEAMYLMSMLLLILIMGSIREIVAYAVEKIVEPVKPITNENMYADYPYLRELDMSYQTAFDFPMHQVLLDHERLSAYICNYCGIQSIYNQTLSKLPHLTLIVLKHNALKYVHPDSFQHNSRLDHIDLSGNQLVTINSQATLRHISSVSILNLSQNRKLDINRVKLECDRLMIFSCNNCATTYLDRNSFAGMSRLSHINFNENMVDQIHYDALEWLSYLKTLNIDGNRNLTMLSFSSNSLKWLSAENCSLEGTLQTSNLPALKTINVRGNRITHLDELSLVTNRKINTLLLDDNELEKIPNILIKLPELQGLCLDQNLLQPYEHIDEATLVYKKRFLRQNCSQDDVFHHKFEYHLPNKNGVAVYKKNPVHSVSNNGATIDLSGRNIVFIEQDYLIDYANVLEFMFDNNQQFDFKESMPFLESYSVEILYMRNCSITALNSSTFEKLPKLTSLHLQGNQILSLQGTSFYPQHGLTYINLAGNNLQLISITAFLLLGILKVIILDDNQHFWRTNRRHFLISTSISNLSCENCGVEQLTDETFDMMPNLRALNLQNNNLSSFDIEPLNELETLCIDDTYLDNTTLHKLEKHFDRATELEAGCKKQSLSRLLRSKINSRNILYDIADATAMTDATEETIIERSFVGNVFKRFARRSAGQAISINVLVLLVSLLLACHRYGSHTHT
ncbi:AAEL014956-PA [Aedes aegypti]|uniref:AAEL014956-PA n=1 Tax=Aedes aegypti TaxID=7159 RepID=Q16EZ7_AEDAE|nr:AAEL014956-PA [Aedes aegypti]